MTDIQEYDIKPFYADLINPSESNYTTAGGSKIVVIGKAGTGKSTLIRYLLFLKRSIIPVGTIVSGTEESNSFYSKIVPSLFIHTEYNEKIITDFIKRQKYAREHIQENPWAFLLLDDCTEDKKIFSSKYQQALFKNGRHWKMFYILSLQHSTDIPPSIRTNVDGVFIFRETNENNLKNIYTNYAGVIPKFEIFKAYMSQVTGDYTALYIDNAAQDNGHWHEHVYYWKVPQMDANEMKLGCHEYIEFGKQRFDEKWATRN
ncbi:ATPase 3 [Armadillidium vulgare iridescent virus]|uniref:ATPase 3 n=1 Tax=Armadillidium vulgare iridescent virus TaxID=72201 RepID=A0A068QKC1_9VIRU|nr:ATPase 3 [Armadillidium vulgare iridescent virus]CCV02472.1 ATPase 3 [Armadillidium vulgare iridescent virus]